MGIPNRSRLLDYVDHADDAGCAETEPPGGPAEAPASPSTPVPRRSRLLEYVDPVAPAEAAPSAPSGPRPGVPAYHTPVFVPAHPRRVAAPDPSGAPTLIPLIAYELFAHSADGTVALAFTTLDGLVAALGEAQPWVATSLGPLAEGVGEQGVTVHVDPWIAPGPHNWQPADLAAYAREAH
ncbi:MULTISPECIES: SAV_915 family protein [unclassified Streptomyces]|uniref:SAV_915 family protein n=1 Tax=unclassified Streptomyces TaxID=2593676 RepID=UPI0033A9EB36